MINRLDNFLNSFTMYRVVLYGLVSLSIISLVLGFLGLIPYSGVELLISLILLVITAYLSNILFAKLFKAIANNESSFITALILFLSLSPGNTFNNLILLFIAATVAQLSKYIFAINKKHLFNPAAVALVLVGLTGLGGAGWWVSHPYLLPFVAVVGLLVVRKIRRFLLVLSFIAGSTLVQLLLTKTFITPADYGRNLFFMTVMLTEPLTSPASRLHQIIFGFLVGGLFSFPFVLGPIFSSAELSLVLGNIYNYFVSFKKRLILKLTDKNNLSADIYEFSFTPDQKFDFKAGQYMEWTINSPKGDDRGNRRFFTIASSPTEKEVKVAARIPEKSSDFKKKLLDLKNGDKLSATNVAGEFVLPEDKNQKLLFVAGGIGITPFRSMIKYLLDKEEKRDIVLFYSVSKASEFVYKELFESAKAIGVKTIYVDSEKQGFLDIEKIKKGAPDFETRKVYISGPPVMVKSFKPLFKDSVTDLFFGY